MDKLNKDLDEVVNYIKNSKEYKKCLELKEKMNSNDEINSLVKEIKLKQKKYIRTNDSTILSELSELEEKLNCIPIYHVYTENLEKVNSYINYVKDELNDYFDKLLNI